MSEISSRASLRILTDEDDVDFISSNLNMRPTSSYRKGELRSKRNPKSSKFEQSLWIYDAPLDDSVELSQHINHILNLLESKREAFNAIRGRILIMDISCMFSSEHGQGSMELDPEILRRLANQQIRLVIDLYPPN